MKLFNFFRLKRSSKNIEIGQSGKVNKKQEQERLTYTLKSEPSIHDLLTFINENKNRLGFTLNKKASDAEIEQFEKNKIHLPDDLKTFYKFCNGFETNEYLFRLIPLNEIISNGFKNKTSFDIAEYLIYSDVWTIDINQNNKNDYQIYNKADDIVILTNSFTEFLVRFINRGLFEGLCYWREEIKSNSY